ncbi:DNA-binding protein [Erwinia tasmaniensis]|uniref:Probable HrpW-specific chaperone (Hrp cluster) n=1 Tax=Erwinia tasmaniensis (strain DSM 17950 / CFBP 7177 / CIP 109463 / NCPPB 4357 / Et1/99) TaxID=465817 RepID=B2VJH4_ERWT9|nr:DNA-binding protein [Erwinia tasmaniensis]CAO95586.1 Probable HrpW-specific chaperone (hrp cluster) [Erwinia tasmaniensis Et1/99]
MMISDEARPAESWVDVVNGQQRLSPAQYQAFQQAISQVKQRLQQVLGSPLPQRQGEFDLDSFVDGLHADFLDGDAKGQEGDVGQTAWWITRYLADRLLEWQQLEQRRG